MTVRHSEASKKRLSDDPKVRSNMMSLLAKKRWEKMSLEARREHALKMVKARHNVKQITSSF